MEQRRKAHQKLLEAKKEKEEQLTKEKGDEGERIFWGIFGGVVGTAAVGTGGYFGYKYYKKSHPTA